MAEANFRVVEADELRNLLDTQCSPSSKYKAYVVGPDITGRIAHCGSYHSIADAQRAAERLNGATGN